MEQTEAQMLVDEIDELLEQIRRKGYSVTFDSRRFDDYGCYLSLSITQSDSDERRVNKYFRLFGVDNAQYGSIINIDGDEYKIVDVNERARRYPVVLESRSGGRYKVSTTAIREARVVKY